MTNRYIIVWLDHENSDLNVETFDSKDEAKAFLESEEYSNYKAILVKVENICDQGITPVTVDIEHHT